jgi:tetratricopeptide (TPR) repeat protein
MERAAVEPLPDIETFLGQWRVLVAKEAAGERRSDWDSETDRWLREVVQRIEGSGGLAKVARATKRAGDLRAWCQSLVEAGDWRGALAAFEEAAELVSDENYARGEFLDGAALAAQELGESDLSPWFERAWRAEPSLPRLHRWLGAARDGTTLRTRAAEALGACPAQAHRQRAVLHVLQGDFDAAAKLLAAAPGLGWSSGEHPGHVLFPLFLTLLGVDGVPLPDIALADREMDIGEMEILGADADEPHLATPELADILRQAGVEQVTDTQARKAVLAAMRKAAKKRVAGVTKQKRRRHYGHAAALVAACVAGDRSAESAPWAATIRQEYRRFPAFRAELDRHLRSA